MEMLKKFWEGKDGKYVTDESVCRCWRKSNVLPTSWNADINNNVGSASLPEKAVTLSKADTLELCQLVADVKLKADGVYLDVHASAKVFKDTFVSDPNCSPQDLQDIADAWFNIEDNQDVIHAVSDDELEDLEKEAQTATDTSPYEDNSEDKELVDITVQEITDAQAPSDDFMALTKLQGPYSSKK
eukprot:3778849-Ditylum_brightwellii.AAC.1